MTTHDWYDRVKELVQDQVNLIWSGLEGVQRSVSQMVSERLDVISDSIGTGTGGDFCEYMGEMPDPATMKPGPSHHVEGIARLRMNNPAVYDALLAGAREVQAMVAAADTVEKAISVRRRVKKLMIDISAM